MTRSATCWFSRKACLLQQRVHQRRLAVVDMRDDGDIAEFHCGENFQRRERLLLQRNIAICRPITMALKREHSLRPPGKSSAHLPVTRMPCSSRIGPNPQEASLLRIEPYRLPSDPQGSLSVPSSWQKGLGGGLCRFLAVCVVAVVVVFGALPARADGARHFQLSADASAGLDDWAEFTTGARLQLSQRGVLSLSGTAATEFDSFFSLNGRVGYSQIF